MLARLTLLSLTALLVVGCGSQRSERPAVARYIRQVQTIEASLATPLATVTQAGAEFAQTQRPHPSLVASLVAASDRRAMAGATRKIESLRSRLSALPAPAPALRLRTMLVELVDLQARVAREVQQLEAFLPRFAAALRPLGPATQRLELALSQRSAYGTAAVAAAYTAKAAALRRFQASANAVLGHLRRLRPPPVSEPGYRSQVAALLGMSASAGRLARALASGPQGDLGGLLSDFDRAALSTQSKAAERAQIAAVRAYDSQSDKMTALSDRITRERLRLADTIQ